MEETTTQVTCICGLNVNKSFINRHLKSQRHLDRVEILRITILSAEKMRHNILFL